MIFKDVVFLIADGNPDSQGQYFAMDSKIEIVEEVRVWSNPAKVHFVGWAKNVRRMDSVFIADIHVHEGFDDIPVEVLRHLVPCVSGVTRERSGDILKDIRIIKIDLEPWNADKRIKPLSAYTFVRD